MRLTVRGHCVLSPARGDIIGLAGNLSYPIFTVLLLKLKSLGFNYKFNGLTSDPETNELMKAFLFNLKAGQKQTVITQGDVSCSSFRIGIVTGPFYHLIYIGSHSRHQTRLKRKRLLL